MVDLTEVMIDFLYDYEEKLEGFSIYVDISMAERFENNMRGFEGLTPLDNGELMGQYKHTDNM